MKTPIIILIFFSFTLSLAAQQESDPQPTTHSKPNYIKSGFYLKLGPVLPAGLFSAGQIIMDPPPVSSVAFFPPAQIGGNLGLGYLIYIGPGVANNHLRFGIDASFLDAWFASSDHVIPPGSNKKETEFWYYFIGQKFGPLITINPVDKLMIDLSYKLNANLSWHNSDWGGSILGQEVMMNIRYRVFLISFAYNTASVNYNDLDGSRPVHDVDVSSFRFLFGFKF